MQDPVDNQRHARTIRWLTCLVFFSFAMTTDAVDSVIPCLFIAFSQVFIAAGVILFFTAAAATLAPLLMAVVSDAYGSARAEFFFAIVLAEQLFAGLSANLIFDPSRARLHLRDGE